MPDPQRRYADQLPHERRAERRARLLAAAAAEIARHGYGTLAIERLCAAARVSTRAFYEEFRAKEDVLGALHDELNERALHAAVTALAAADPHDPRARARAGFGAYFATMTADPDLAKVVLVDAVGVSPAMEARRQVAVDRFAELVVVELDRLAAVGALPPGRDHHGIAQAAVGATKELVTSGVHGPLADRTPADLADLAAHVLLAAVTTPR